MTLEMQDVEKAIREYFVNRGYIDLNLKPNQETSGHRIATPLEEEVYEALSKAYPGLTFKQHEALNDYLLQTVAQGRVPDGFVFGNEAVDSLVNPGKKALSHWPEKIVLGRQSDTADIVLFSDSALFDGSSVFLIDVKSHDFGKNSQPPNIMSARKLAKVAEICLSKNIDPNFSLYYIDLGYRKKDAGVVVEDVRMVDMMKIPPLDYNGKGKPLYINWSAAIQVQFRPSEVSQDFQLSQKDWLAIFMKNYTSQKRDRIYKEVHELGEQEKMLAEYYAKNGYILEANRIISDRLEIKSPQDSVEGVKKSNSQLGQNIGARNGLNQINQLRRLQNDNNSRGDLSL